MSVISTPSNTCPDCGVVGLPYVCGSPADPSAGQDCRDREAAARAARGLPPRCRCQADDCRGDAQASGFCSYCEAAGCTRG